MMPKTISSVAARQVVPWTLFGSSGRVEKTDGLVVDAFRMRRALPECNGDTCAYKVCVCVCVCVCVRERERARETASSLMPS